MPEENEKKKSKLFDKIVMGAIIGGAIGSVVGASVRCKKEEDKKESGKIFKKFLSVFRRKGTNDLKEIPNELEEYKK